MFKNKTACMLLDKSALPGFTPLPAAPLAVAGDRDETQPMLEPAVMEAAAAAAAAFDMVMPVHDDVPAGLDQV